MKYIVLIFTLFFSACSVKNYEHTQTKIILIKSPKLKFADLGFVRNNDNSIELELFAAGNSIQKITINHLICVDDGCMSKDGFNKDYLNEAYPDDMLQNILLGHIIYDGEGLVKTAGGFEQRIKDAHVDITYNVGGQTIEFKDKKNKIIFIIKDTEQR